jgi:TonB family protein
MTALRDVAIRLDEGRRREFRRVLAISAAAHLVGFLTLALAPGLPRVSPPAAVAVNLVAAPAGPRAPAPPAVKPPAPPKPPKPAPVVLPTEPTTPKLEPKAPKPEKPKPEPVKKPEQDYADVLDQLRAEAGEPEPQPSAEPAEPASQIGEVASAGVPGGQPVSGEVAAWMRDARVHIRRNWAVPPGFRTESLVTEVEVELDAAGNVQGEPRLIKRSGNPWYDDGVVRGVRKASPLPAPPEAGTWTFVMVSDEDW